MTENEPLTTGRTESGEELEAEPELHPIIGRVVAFHTRQRQMGGGVGHLWYRGHADASWALVPGALRKAFLDTAVANLPAGVAVERPNAGILLERLINEQFLREAAGLLTRPEHLASIYFEAQHHGFPTRLLDWTTDALIALFFAAVEQPGVAGKVLVLSPMNHYYYDLLAEDTSAGQVRTRRIAVRTPVRGTHESFEGQLGNLFNQFDPSSSVLPAGGPDDRLIDLEANSGGRFTPPTTTLDMILPVLPGLDFTRITSQRGCFTFHPFEAGPLQTIAFFDVPAEEKGAIVADLISLGVDWSRVYPDLDGVSRAIRLRFGLG